MQDDSKQRTDKSPRAGGPDGLPEHWPFSDGNAAIASAIGLQSKQALLAALQGPFALKTGEHLARYGDPLRDLFIVNAGSLKAYTDDTNGREHVQGFYFPGEWVGFDAIYARSHRANISALEASSIFALSHATLMELIARHADLDNALLRFMAEYAIRASALAGDYKSKELLAGFLLMLSRRQVMHGPSSNYFILSMSRRDIASYLRLAPETVSRLLTQFSSEGLIRLDHRTVELFDPPRLARLAGDLKDS